MSAQVQSQPQTFSYEKKMGSGSVHFDIVVTLLGETPAKPDTVHPNYGTIPGDDGETLWHVYVGGPAYTEMAYFRSFKAGATAADVADMSFARIGRPW